GGAAHRVPRRAARHAGLRSAVVLRPEAAGALRGLPQHRGRRHLARGPRGDRMVSRLRPHPLSRRVAGAALGLLLLATACRGRPPGQTEETVARLVDSLVPAVEKFASLRFRTPPRSAVRSRDQVRAYVLAKLDQEF